MYYYKKEETGKRIRECRKARGLTQNQLAEAIGFAGERHIQRIERGENSISIDKLIEVSQIFGVSTDFLLFGGKQEKDERILAAIKSLSEQEIQLLLGMIQVIRQYSEGKSIPDNVATRT
jgi:putative transcriptional regulator